MFKEMNSPLKFAIVLLHSVAIVSSDIPMLITISMFTICLMILAKIPLKKYIPYLSFGLIISIFIFILSLLLRGSLLIAFASFIQSFWRYLLLIVITVIFAFTTKSKDIAYSIIYLPLRLNLNVKSFYFQTMFILTYLVVAKQLLKEIISFERKLNPKTKIVGVSKQLFGLINPFVNVLLKRSRKITLAILNKQYNPLALDFTIYYRYNRVYNKYLIFYIILFILALLVATMNF